MKITLSHPSCPDTYQIRPYKQGTCLELIKNPHETVTHTIKGRTFVTPKDRHPKYPWDYAHGFELAVKQMYMNPKSTDEPIEIDLSTEKEKISQYFKEWLDKVMVKVEED